MRRLLLLALITSACFEKEGDPPDPAFRGDCGSNRGLDLLWDVAHNDPSGLDGPPTQGPGWQLFQDPGWPLLGFMYPPDWTAVSLSDQAHIGVYLESNDGTASFMLLYVLYPRADLGSAEVVSTEMAALAGGATLSGPLCSDTTNVVTTVGTDGKIEARAAAGDLFMVQSSVIYDPGNLGYGPGVAMNAAIYRFAAPEEDFTRVTEEVFLPIIFQLYIGDSDNVDTDADGIYDRNDDFPFDPTRS